jgi:hypothetical protein
MNGVPDDSQCPQISLGEKVPIFVDLLPRKRISPIAWMRFVERQIGNIEGYLLLAELGYKILLFRGYCPSFAYELK